MASTPSASSFAVLGLLAVQPWSAYELVAQSKRSLHYFWPRSEAHLYAELKKIVERGHATVEVVENGNRQRSRYSITDAGRAALADWLGTAPAPPTVEAEMLVRTLLADQGTITDFRRALENTTVRTLETLSAAVALGEDLLETGGPFPQRLHLTERAVAFYGEFLKLVIDWCDETMAVTSTWPDTQCIGLDDAARRRMATLVAEGHERIGRAQRHARAD